jgi:hypothetical protein
MIDYKPRNESDKPEIYYLRSPRELRSASRRRAEHVLLYVLFALLAGVGSYWLGLLFQDVMRPMLRFLFTP